MNNFSMSEVVTPPSPATTGNSITITTGTGSLFIRGYATVYPQDETPNVSNAEIIAIVNISGDTLTIVRHAQETTARSIVAGDNIVQGVTAEDWNYIESFFIGPSFVTFSSTSNAEAGQVDGTIDGINDTFTLVLESSPFNYLLSGSLNVWVGGQRLDGGSWSPEYVEDNLVVGGIVLSTPPASGSTIIVDYIKNKYVPLH